MIFYIFLVHIEPLSRILEIFSIDWQVRSVFGRIELKRDSMKLANGLPRYFSRRAFSRVVFNF